MSATKHSALLASYLQQLQTRPLATKAVTTGILCFLQEILGSNIAGVPPKPHKDAPLLLQFLARKHVDIRAAKVCRALRALTSLRSSPRPSPDVYLWAACICARLSLLNGPAAEGVRGQDQFRRKGNLGQLLAQLLIVAPVQTATYLASLAVIGGANSVDEVVRTVKVGFLPVIRVSWVTTPTAMVFAQKFVPMELWTPFFSFVSFAVGTIFNVRIKAIRLAAAKKQALKDKAAEAEKKEE
ncbi:hypothetical protein HMN09_00622800 [Mycena chlorophos]|uniref:Integral membrane protein n=1 Tax=Mycena chlorophos TaxID=658473 RepID=A0A8H6T330_MYCCL|nr:hypothetical protein HMN09_00622800 [Mycena chlorophos]